MNLPNGTFGKATVNPDGSVTVSNNLGTITLTKQQMSQVATGDMSALKPLMGNSAAGKAQGVPIITSNGHVTHVQLPNGTFGKAVMNSDGSITVSNNLGTVTLTKQQMSQVAAGDTSALKPLIANGAAGPSPQAPIVSSNGNVTQIKLPNGTFGKVTQNPDGTVTLSNNLGTVTLTPQQMSKVAAGDMSALKSLTGSGSSVGSNLIGAGATQPQMKTASVTGTTLPDNNSNATVGSQYSYTTAYGSYKPQCPNNTCTGTYQGTMSLSDFNALDYSKSGFGVVTSPTLKPGIYTVNLNTHGGTSNRYVFVDAPTNVAGNNPVTPAISSNLPAGGRQPIYVQDANGLWHNSYWFAPPADVLANYGPLSEASSQPVLPFGFNYANGPPPNAQFADDSNNNSSRGNNNPGDNDSWPNPKLQRSPDDGNNDDTQEAAKNAPTQIAAASPVPEDPDEANLQKYGTADADYLRMLQDIGQAPKDDPNIPPLNNNVGLSTDPSLEAQVAENTKKIAQQIDAENALSTTPTDYGTVVSATLCVSRCYGGSFAIDSSGVNAYVLDPDNSAGTPTLSFSAQMGRNPQSVAGGDSITTTVPVAFGGDTAVSVSVGPDGKPDGKGVTWGVSYGMPGVAMTRGLPLGNIAPTGYSPPTGRYRVFTDNQGNVWGEKGGRTAKKCLSDETRIRLVNRSTRC
ncbi:hypothetical protein ACVWWG_003813 [Bradyrhizobium sp. LB7.2]